ncbi:MAG: class I SAM-dependent methyltransferase [Gemmatimonadetes bacterium]|nr:class I SAM-dependent methyltransferase [Gemmatimonadota bacterium]
MPRKSLYDVAAPLYGRLVPGFVERTLSRAVQRVSTGSPETLLEVAIGPGHTIPLLQKRTSARSVAVDTSRAMLKLAQGKASSIAMELAPVQGDVLNLPFKTSSFDAVLSTFLVDVIKRPKLEQSLSEMVRVLAPGGRVVIAQLHISSRLINSVWDFAHSLLPESLGFVRPVDISDLFSGVGLRLIQDEVIDEAIGTRVTTLMAVRSSWT